MLKTSGYPDSFCYNHSKSLCRRFNLALMNLQEMCHQIQSTNHTNPSHRSHKSYEMVFSLKSIDRLKVGELFFTKRKDFFWKYTGKTNLFDFSNFSRHSIYWLENSWDVVIFANPDSFTKIAAATNINC